MEGLRLSVVLVEGVRVELRVLTMEGHRYEACFVRHSPGAVLVHRLKAWL
jgi:hypothetical protein